MCFIMMFEQKMYLINECNIFPRIVIALDQRRISWIRIDGSMTRKEKTKNLKRFSEDQSIRVLLGSINAAGTGLNITCANTCFIMVSFLSSFMTHGYAD